MKRPGLHVLHGSRAEQGRKVLADVERFLGFFVAYPSEAARVAHVLWCAHAHGMKAFETTPRLAFLSPEPGSGKSRALEMTALLVPRAIEAVNVSSAYLIRKVAADEFDPPTVLLDEIDAVFGPKAHGYEDLRALLNAGHRRGAIVGRCVVRGKVVETEELPAFAAVALAGLGDLPDTIATRSVIIRMRRRAANERVTPYRRRQHMKEGHGHRDQLADWIGGITGYLAAARPDMPDGIADRNADVWEPLLAVADAAGGDWPERARVAAVALVAVSREDRPSPGVELLADLRQVFGAQEAMTTGSILDGLYALPETAWADCRGKPLNDRGLANMLRAYNIKPKVIRMGGSTPRGYLRADFGDAWNRYLSLPSAGSATAQHPQHP